jgi:hypothetical protein
MRLLLILVLCLNAAVAQSPKQPASDEQNAKAHADKSAVNQKTSDTGKASENRVYTNYQYVPERDKTAKEVGDYLLAAFTFALVIVSLMQWAVLRKHEEWMQKHDANLEKLAQAAKDNAGAAKVSADAARDSFKSVMDSERAWVVADAPFVPPSVATGPPVKIECAIRNRGNTMARVVEKRENYSIQASLNELPEAPDYGTKFEWPNGHILAPASESVLRRELQVTNAEMWQKIKEGTLVLFVYGYVRYWDVFDREHETRYIFRLNPIPKWCFNLEDRTEYTRTT